MKSLTRRLPALIPFTMLISIVFVPCISSSGASAAEMTSPAGDDITFLVAFQDDGWKSTRELEPDTSLDGPPVPWHTTEDLATPSVDSTTAAPAAEDPPISGGVGGHADPSLDPYTGPMLEEDQALTGLDIGVGFDRDETITRGRGVYDSGFCFLNLKKTTENEYETFNTRPFLMYGVMNNLMLILSNDLVVSDGYSTDTSWDQNFHYEAPWDPTRTFRGEYTGVDNHSIDREWEGSLELTYRPLEYLEVYARWFMEQYYTYSRDNYRHVTPATNPQFNTDSVDVIIEEYDLNTHSVSLGIAALLGDAGPTGTGSLDLNAFNGAFLAPMSVLAELEFGVDIVRNDTTQWFRNSFDYFPGFQQINPSILMNVWEEDFTNVSRSIIDDYEQYYLKGAVEIGIVDSLNTGVSGGVDFPVTWDRDLRRTDSPYQFFNPSRPERTFWGEDDSGRLFSWNLECFIAYRPTPYFEAALSQGFSYREAEYDGLYYSNLLPTAAVIVTDGGIETHDDTRRMQYDTTLALTFLTRGGDYDYSAVSIDTLDSPLLGRNQLGLTGSFTYRYVDMSRGYDMGQNFPGGLVGIDSWRLSMDYDQYIVGLGVSYGLLDNLMLSVSGTYAFPGSYTNHGEYLWAYDGGDYGFVPTRTTGRMKNWSAGAAVRYRIIDNLEIGLGGTVVYTYERCFMKNGKFYSQNITPSTFSHHWGDSYEYYDFDLGLSLRFLF